MKRLPILLVLLAALTGPLSAQVDKRGLLNSRHDFRPTSTATIRAASGPAGDDQLCMYCHIPHNSNPGPLLWNQEMSTTQFPTYTSTTLQSTVPPVTAQDSSKLCLSCHDGTIALGNTISNGDIPFVQGPGYQLPASSRSNLAGFGGYGFTDDHPFAFSPNFSNPQIKMPDLGNPVRLVAGKVQCSSCHDPHNESADPVQEKFLVKKNQGSALCLSCHQQTGWDNSAHKQPSNATEDAKYTSLQGAHTGYTGVANNGCESCHRPHAPIVAQRLLKFLEEDTCYQCHDASVANLDVKTEFLTKTYRHPVGTTPSAHDASEGPGSPQFPMPETSASTPRHAECADCHNSHAAQATPSASTPQPPAVSPALIGVKGQSATNVFLLQASNQYEICFKCHGESVNKPQTDDVTTTGTGYGRNPQRQADFTGTSPLPTRGNTRLEFTTRPFSHPVSQPANLSTGPLGDVPSLRPYVLDSSSANIISRPLTSASLIFCTDCHNNDTGRNLGPGSSGPTGPHASNFAHLLERSYPLEMAPATPGGPNGGISYSAGTYALCDKCHDLQNSILQNVGFKKHMEHILNTGAACSTCHDAHSSPSPMLINFDRSIVGPYNGQMQFLRTGTGHGTCTLVCHGKTHNNLNY